MQRETSDYYQKCARSVKFQTAGFFEDNVDRLYSFNSQKSVISKSLGVAETKYFDKESNLFLSRGHLAGKAIGDISICERAPQWQTFNGGNWNSLENNIRALSLRHTVPLEFYSGTIGISSLPNSKNVSQEIYLHDTKTEKKIPVPKLYFRVILEQEQSSKRRKGVVVIGVNNPYANPSEIRNSYKICEPNVIDKLSWLDSLKGDLKNNQKGYLYACEVKDFVKNVKFLPPITNVDQLLI
uniref:DNA/RNA non-specific endonuclease/pyrophosphatase/phosphodiesterase domain-containing protein n=1 Tax=Megaselia scalaris TaxID=36166 RepID=T1GSB5_MEGSC